MFDPGDIFLLSVITWVIISSVSESLFLHPLTSVLCLLVASIHAQRYFQYVQELICQVPTSAFAFNCSDPKDIVLKSNHL